MKRHILTILVAILCFSYEGYSQLKLKISTTKGQKVLEKKESLRTESKNQIQENIQEKSKKNMSEKANMIYANKEYKNFEEASAHSIKEIKDGDDVWMYVKLDKPLSNYIDVDKYTDSDGNLIELHSFHIIIGPKGETYPEFAQQRVYVNAGKNIDKDPSIRSAFVGRLDIDPSTTTDFKILLSKYLRRTSTTVLLQAVGGGNAGRWDNEIRLVHKNKTITFANAPILCNVVDGIAKYRKAWKEYENVIQNGDIADNVLPPTGKFTDAKLKVKILEKLKTHKGLPHSLNFTFDDWEIVIDDNGRRRKVYAYALYKQNGKCSYTMVEVEQIMTVFQSTWSEARIHFYKEDSPIECK